MKALKVLAQFCFVLLLLSTGSCTQQHPSASPSHEIVFAIGQMPLNLDPRYATDAASECINRLVYQSLVDFDAQSKPVASLASWLEISPTLFRFTLNKNRAPFHNQAPLTANDVKATYDSLATLKDSPNTAEFANIKSITVIDNDTVEFQLKQADQHFPAKLVLGILPTKLISENHDFSHAPVGNGALKFVSWQNKLTLQRVNDNQKISLIEVKDPTVRVLKLLHGEVDLLQGELPPELVKYLQTKPEVTVKTSTGANFSYLGLNFKDPILQQLKVRQALAHAIDRKQIIAKAMIEHSREADMILPPEHYTNQNSLAPANDYNPSLAKQLLQEAGVKLPLKLVYKTSTDAQRVRFATILQAQMAKAGIALEIRSLDWGTFFEDVKQGNFQLYGLTWVGIKTPEIYAKAFGSHSFPPNGFNRGRYADAELDKLLADENWQAATVRIRQQLPYVPLWYEGQFSAMRKGISQYNAKADGNWDDLGTISYAH
ncbi:MAG: ABC transporter substrate-binding protein [Methylotenera sp.]|uniref:ABC transporter substrate-binding protein n=1 Tax=Methylotenera sp. TaxID=2051956 RepID=UPI00248A5892|nr:ABC transporter substrate-binding protein [Methylotenera sp.]MDI1308379.1 ABC transporter substrate-binding protein [Methylotenera sp.]